jgi:hypothetical protein
MGMIGGGLLLVFIAPVFGLDKAPLAWGLFSLLALVLLGIWHRKNGPSPYYFPKGKSRRNRIRCAIYEVARGLTFTRRQDLLRNASWALLFLVITFYLLSYSAHTIYSVSFDSEQALAGFFGMLVIATNVSAMLLQLFVSNRVIERIGVRRAKLIYPLTTIASFIFLVLHPGFFAAVFTNINRETIMPAFRNPARQMFFNILPDYMKGRARAISIAVIMPVALFICGLLILAMQRYGNLTAIAWSGLALALLYLFFCVRMGANYVSTLIASMREKLYLPEELTLNYRDSDGRMFDELVGGLNDADDDVSLSYARALVVSYPEHAADLILERIHSAQVQIADQMLRLISERTPASRIAGDIQDLLSRILEFGDDHLLATAYTAVFNVGREKKQSLMRQTIQNSCSRIRCAGIRAALLYGDENMRRTALVAWHALLTSGNRPGSDWAVADLLPIIVRVSNLDVRQELVEAYPDVMLRLIRGPDYSRREQVYVLLSHWQWPLPDTIADAIISDLNHHLPEVRAAAMICLPVLPVRYEWKHRVWTGLDDGHMRVRKAALKVIELQCRDKSQQLYEWIRDNTQGTPRAQKVLLESLINSGASSSMLSRIAETRIAYAAEILSVLHDLGNGASEAVEVQLLKMVLHERFGQVVDLALLALQPMVESGDIAVIRAGIKTRDVRYRSDALEALQCLQNNELASRIGLLVGHDYDRIIRSGMGRLFNSFSDAVAWCVDNNDDWICINGKRTMAARA